MITEATSTHVRHAETDSRIQESRQRILELMKGPLCDAKAAGTLRRDFAVEDVLVVFGMARGAMDGLADSGARSMVAHRVLALVLGGIEKSGPE